MRERWAGRTKSDVEAATEVHSQNGKQARAGANHHIGPRTQFFLAWFRWLMPGNGAEENKKRGQFEQRGERQQDSPLPKVNIGKPAHCHAGCPHPPTRPSGAEGWTCTSLERWNGIEANSHNEARHPTEHLCVAVCLQPCGRDRTH